MSAAKGGGWTIAPNAAWRNDDVDWDRWPVQRYISENYRELHPADLAVMEHDAQFLATLTDEPVDVSIEFGAGPNLYPLMLAAAVSAHVHAVERSAASVDYLRQQLRGPLDPTWLPFYDHCRALLPRLPATPMEALSVVTVIHGPVARTPHDRYGLGSMHFVAESATEDLDEFRDLCLTFIRAVRPGAPLVAAFMENMGRYRLGDGSRWPGCPVDAEVVRAAFAPYTTNLEVIRIDADSSLPDYGYTGMVLLTARRKG